MSRFMYRHLEIRQPETPHEAHIFLHDAIAHLRNQGAPKILADRNAWSNYYDTQEILSMAATSVALSEVAA